MSDGTLSGQTVTSPYAIRCVNPAETAYVSCGSSAADNCYSGSNATAAQFAGSAITPSGKLLTWSNGVWVEAGSGTRVLAADGTDNWQVTLSPDGRSYSTNLLNKANVAGRRCPPNVFVPGNLVATGRCLYYDQGSASGIRLDATANDLTTDQTTAGAIRLGRWDSEAGGNGTGRSWYEGNIQMCAAKGMRLPTLYELSPGPCGYGLPTDATVTQWPDVNTQVPNVIVPNLGASWTWSATASTDVWQYLFIAQSCALNYINNPIYVRCVVPY